MNTPTVTKASTKTTTEITLDPAATIIPTNEGGIAPDRVTITRALNSAGNFHMTIRIEGNIPGRNGLREELWIEINNDTEDTHSDNLPATNWLPNLTPPAKIVEQDIPITEVPEWLQDIITRYRAGL